MRRGDWARDPDGLLDRSRDGLLTARELEDLGVPQSTTYRRCRHGGPWQRLLPGVVLLRTGAPSTRQREVAALLHAGPGSMITGVGGARHHGLRRGPAPEDVHVLVPLARQVRTAGFATVERTRRLPRTRERDGLPVAPLERCVLDASRRLRDPDTIASILAEPVQRRLLLAQALSAELEAGCRKGSAAPRQVLRAVLDGVGSTAEFRAHAFWSTRPELPAIEWNVRIRTLAGELLAIVDGLVRELGFVWEIDSVEEHFATPDQVRATNARRRRLQDAGFVVVTTRPTELRDDPDGVLRDLVIGMATAAELPEPRGVLLAPR